MPSALALALALHFATTAAARDFMAGADISSLTVLENDGAVYRDAGVPGDAIEILRDHGANWFRLRLFVDPQQQNNYNGNFDAFVVQDLDYTIELAQRIKNAGGKFLLDFHYSDTWADPGHQWKPEAWRSLATAEALQQQVYDYTKASIEAFKAAQVMPDMVQIGNEIANGLLWNGEYVSNVNNSTVGGATTGYPWTGGNNSTGLNRLANLLSAGINGARDGSDPGHEPLIMVHHDKGSQWGTTGYFFDEIITRLQNNGTDIDVIGYSYYPQYHSGGIAAVEQNLNNTVAEFGKPVVLVETGFPFRNPQSDEQNLGFPVTQAGQQQFLQALVDTVLAVPNEMGLGVFWWYAEARQTPNLNIWEGARYSLFDQNGNLLPAATVFEQFLPTGDFNDDGVVDALDYAVWRNGLGTEYDEGDYLVWQENYGTILAGSGGLTTDAPQAVPEPASVILVLTFALSITLKRRRR
jgi:arabinogalactan endo-1,4-beta-galactosidase